MGNASRIRRTLSDVPQHVLGDQRGLWNVVVPEESTNLIANPSFETNVTGWVAGGTGASVSKSTLVSVFGSASLQFLDVAASGVEYASTGNIAISPSTTYTWSFYWRKTSDPGQTGTYRADFYTSAPALISSVSGTLPPGAVGDWRRSSITFLTPATTASVVLVYLAPASGAYALYVDGAQLESKAFPTTYIDGDQEDCLWLGTPHGSQSYRPAWTRKGGRVWNFRDWKFSVNAIIGTSAAALTTIATPYALIGGGNYQRSVAPPRAFSIVGGFECAGDIDLKRSRNNLFGAISPFSVDPQQPARLIYAPTDCDMEIGKQVVIDAVYTGGLEGNQTNDAGRENHALGFQTYLPFAALGKGAVDRAASLTTHEGFTAGSNLLLKRNLHTGDFEDISSTLNNSTRVIKKDFIGGVYVGGAFTSPQTRIMYYNGTAFSATGSGANGEVYDIAVEAAGTVVAVGAFTNIGGTAVTGIARWNGSTWSAIGGSVAGGSATVYAVVIDSVGGIYIGGSFTTVNGVAATNVARWNGSAWTAIDQGVNNSVFALVLNDGKLYAGGGFTTMGSGAVAAVGLARWTGSAWESIGNLSGGGYVNSFVVGADGRVYAGGSFSTAGGVSAVNVAVWNGSIWSALGSGVNGAVDQIMLLKDKAILVSGAFTTAGELLANKTAVWTGSEWVWSDLYLAGATTGINATESDNLYEYYQGTASTTFWTAGTTIVTDVVGVSTPELRLIGPGTIYSIKNWTTGTEIRFDLALMTGETATLKFGAQPTFISNVRGNIMGTVLTSSSISEFRLLPGTNYIACLVNDASMLAALVWRDNYGSLDGASN